MKLILPNNNDINGIVHYIQSVDRNKAGNYVKIENSTLQVDYLDWRSAEALIRYDLYKSEGQSNWCSQDIPSSYFILSFFKYSVEITNYTFITRNYNIDHFPKNWKVEGANDGINWQYIDHETDQSDLSQLSVMKTYKVKSPGRYKYFKFEHNGTNSRGFNFFCLGKVDIFGKLYGARSDKECTSKRKGKENKLLIFILIVLE